MLPKNIGVIADHLNRVADRQELYSRDDLASWLRTASEIIRDLGAVIEERHAIRLKEMDPQGRA